MRESKVNTEQKGFLVYHSIVGSVAFVFFSFWEQGKGCIGRETIFLQVG